MIFGLRGTERIYLKSIEYGYIRIIKVSLFQEMGSSTVVRHERQEMSSTASPRVKGSTPVRGNFLAEFFSLKQFWQIWQNDQFTEKLDCLCNSLCELHWWIDGAPLPEQILDQENVTNRHKSRTMTNMTNDLIKRWNHIKSAEATLSNC